MKMRCVVLIFYVAFACVFGESTIKQSTKDVPADEARQPTVTTPSGGIRGSWMVSRRDRQFQAYRGIRYAEPPVGDLRFQAPKLILKYNEEVDATKEGPACPQPTNIDSYVVDEDCLRLNVYTHTNNCSKLLPVVVYIHAGGFYSASGRSDEAGPHYLMDHDLVYVAINYRLGSLGFLSTGDALAPGNNGLKDQVMALRWIQRNIASFCGDPKLVTLSGYSAGSISVGLHLFSPMSRGLFHRARAMSGSPFTQAPYLSNQYHLAKRQARLLNCPTTNSSVILSCLKKVPWKQLGDSLDSMFEFGYDPIVLWLPVVELDFGQERFLVEPPLESVQKGKMHQVPLLLGQTKDEFFMKAFWILSNSTLFERMKNEWEKVASIAFQLPADAKGESASLRNFYLPKGQLLNDSASCDGLGKLYSDAVIGFPVHRMVQLMGNYSQSPVYQYHFDYKGQHSFNVDPVTRKPRGVAHHDDLIYLFSLRLLFPDLPSDRSDDSQMVDLMTSIMYQFAKDGHPNELMKEISWPRVTSNSHQYLNLNLRPSVHDHLFQQRYDLWDNLYPL